MRYYRLYLHLQKKMVILDRKIVHNMQTMCSHITYTEFNLPFIDIPNMNSSCLPAEVGLNLLERGWLTTKRATLHLSEVIFPHLHLCKSRMGNSQETEAMEHSTSETIQFSPDMFPPDILNLPDYEHIADLLSKSQYGIRFYDEGLYEDLLSRLSLFDSQSYTRRLIALYEILERLYNCSQTKLLSPIAFSHYKLLIPILPLTRYSPIYIITSRRRLFSRNLLTLLVRIRRHFADILRNVPTRVYSKYLPTYALNMLVNY